MVAAVIREWGAGEWMQPVDDGALHEATLLRLAIDKAQMRLGWHPRWDFDEAIRRTVDWYKAFYAGADVAACASAQIADYTQRGVAVAPAV